MQGLFSLKYLLNEFIIPNLSQIYFWIPGIFKTNKINFWICSCVVNSQRLFCSQKAGRNDRIKAFWYTLQTSSIYINFSRQFLPCISWWILSTTIWTSLLFLSITSTFSIQQKYVDRIKQKRFYTRGRIRGIWINNWLKFMIGGNY